jgi:Bacterial Ig domain
MVMLRSARLPLLVAVAGALAVPAAASAADSAADCRLQAPRASVDHPIAGTNLTARDPYGGRLTRNRLFFDFSVRGAAADLAGVAKVQWSLDGTVVREDPTLPFQWKGVSGASTRIPAGDHQITVTVVPKSGAPASTQFALTATDCQNAEFTTEVAARRGPASFAWASAFEGAKGEPLTSVGATATRNVAVTLPRALRGRAIGTLTLLGSGSRPEGKSYTLKGSTTALSRGKLRVRLVPGAKGFLKVTGLPAGTQGAAVRLKSGIVRLRSPKASFRVGGTLTAASGSVRLEGGGRYF